MSKNILIVDDDITFVYKIINTIGNKDYFFSTADSLKKAEYLINNDNFDIVLANIKVPGGNTIILKKVIKSGSIKTIFLFMSNVDSDYNFIKNLGENCCHKYDIFNSLKVILNYA